MEKLQLTKENNHILSLEKILQPIRKPLEAIENRFKDCVASENPVIQEMVNYVFNKKGKRIRPALVFISSVIWDSPDQNKIIDLGLSIELIHIATLIHDDVNDRSELRRGVDTYNKKWGNSSSVLFGDFLFCRAFVILAQMGNLQIIQNLSKTTSEICEGEIMQSFLKKNYEISIDKYLEIIRYKTASLIAESCRVGAIITDQDKETQDCLYRYGLNLGMAFQIYDDFLDFHGTEELLGKPVLNDVVNGYITLPMIHLFNQKENGNREQIYQQIEEMQKDNNIKAIIDLLEKNGSLDYSLNKAKSFVTQAQKELEPLTNNKLKDSLLEIAQFIINREF